MTSTAQSEIVATEDPSARLGATGKANGSGRRVGPLNHLAEERDRLLAATWENFSVAQMGTTLGAEIGGIDITGELADDVIEEIRQALYTYKVIFFRDQPLTPERHVAFASRFGDLEIHPFIPANTGQPELVRFEKTAEVGGYENTWHHDVTWRETPSMGAILHAIEVPEFGGDTLFCDMHAVYEGLEDETRELVDGLTVTHDFVRAFGHNMPEERKAEIRELYPEVEHPAVITHEGTGQRLLYVNQIFTTGVVGWSQEDSDALLDVLCRQASIPEYQVRFRWTPDSVAFWDNRAVQHYACSDYWPNRRVMERASIVGGRPV